MDPIPSLWNFSIDEFRARVVSEGNSWTDAAARVLGEFGGKRLSPDDWRERSHQTALKIGNKSVVDWRHAHDLLAAEPLLERSITPVGEVEGWMAMLAIDELGFPCIVLDGSVTVYETAGREGIERILRASIDPNWLNLGDRYLNVGDG